MYNVTSNIIYKTHFQIFLKTLIGNTSVHAHVHFEKHSPHPPYQLKWVPYVYSHISNIIKEKKWKLVWLILFKVKYSSYVIYKVYWKKAIRSFAKEENQAFWLQNEVYYLINEDKNILITEDTWLNGRITDAVQKLKSQSSKQNRQLPVISQFTKKPNYLN